jgi:hypothetical protein
MATPSWINTPSISVSQLVISRSLTDSSLPDHHGRPRPNSPLVTAIPTPDSC